MPQPHDASTTFVVGLLFGVLIGVLGVIAFAHC